jgi:DNA-binding NtrC family response regulator
VEGAGVAEAAHGDPCHLREVERRHVQEVLRQEKGNKVHAARALGISRRALYRLISKHHLDRGHAEENDSRKQTRQDVIR